MARWEFEMHRGHLRAVGSVELGIAAGSRSAAAGIP